HFTTIEARQINFIISMLNHLKVTPQRTKELKPLGLEVVDGNYMFKEGEKPEESHYIINKDGTWDIKTKTLLNLIGNGKKGDDKKIGLIKEHRLDLFFPDQVELEVKDNGEYAVRIEMGAFNLGPTEGMDSIRVYSELGRYLYMTQLYPAMLSKEEYKENLAVADDARRILNDILPHRLADEVIADRYRNVVGLANYFVAHAAMGRAADAKEYDAKLEKYKNPLDPQDKVPQYYNAFTFYRLMKFLEFVQGGGRELNIKASKEAQKLIRTKYERRPLPRKPLPKMFTFGGAMPENAYVNYFARATRRSCIIGCPEEGGFSELTPVTSAQLKKEAMDIKNSDLIKDHERLEERIKNSDPEMVFYLGVALQESGSYREAAKVFLYLVKHMPQPRNETERKILDLSLQKMISVNRVLNVSFIEIADIFEWMSEHPEICHGEKEMYIRGYLTFALNQIERTTEALAQAKIVLDIYEREIGRADWLYHNLQAPIAELKHKGFNFHQVTPAQRLLAQVMADAIVSISRTYKVELDEEFNIYDQKYYFKDAQNLLEMILSDKSASQFKFESVEAKGFAARIESLKKQLPKDIGSDMIFVKTRILDRMVWETYNLYPKRAARNPEMTRKKYVGRISRYNTSLEEIDLSIMTLKKQLPIIDAAIEAELKGRNKNADALYRSYIGIYLFLARLTYEKLVDIYKIRNNNRKRTDEEQKIQDKYINLDLGPIKTEFLGFFDSARNIINAFLQGFENPKSTYLSLLNSNLFSKLQKDNLRTTVLRTVEASADPRNDKYMTWLISALDFRKGAIESMGQLYVKLEESSFREKINIATNEAFEICSRMVQVKVSDDQLNTQYLYQAVLQTGEVLYTTFNVAKDLFTKIFYLIDNALKGFQPLLPEEKKFLEQHGLLSAYTSLEARQKADKAKFREEYSQFKDCVKKNLPLPKALAHYQTEYDKFADLYQNKHREAIKLIFLSMLDSQVVNSDDLKALDELKLLDIYEAIQKNKASLKKMFGREPSFEASAWAMLGNLTWWGRGEIAKYKEAQKYYEKAFEFDSYGIEALLGMAQVYSRLGDEAKSTNKKKDMRVHYAKSYQYILMGVRSMVSGIDFTEENRNRLIEQLQALFNQDVPLKAKAGIQRILKDRKGKDITSEDLRRIHHLARRANAI
ncbi:MAG: hypothetical protein ABIJ26_08300, partial [Candidatus Margulisiibacteriota bacterium]